MRITAATIVLLLALSGCGGGDDTAAGGDETAAGDVTDAATEPAATEPAATEPADTDAAGGGTGEAPPVTLEGNVNDHGTATLEGGSLQMVLGDFFFEPTYVQAEPGATAQLTLVNGGEVSHTFTIDELGIDEVLDGGAEGQVQVTLPDELPLTFYCRFHRAQGMQGAFFTQ